jgi:MoaA/NifB/PqqE/SkfB family radical SAM enzyme
METLNNMEVRKLNALIDKFDLQVDYIIFEVTRKCNMRCRHCLRGEPERINIKNEIIDRVLDDIDSFYMVTFSGGEPFMNFPAIEYIFDQLTNRKIDYSSFYLVTNGKIFKQKYIDKLQYEYDCLNRYRDFCGGICVSIDEFHDEIKEKNLNRFRDLEFYLSEKEHHKRRTDIINEGRANNNGIGTKTPKYETKLYYEIDDNKLRLEGNLYINALGDVLLDCDVSYDNQEEYKIGNVLETSLKEIIFNQILKQEPDFLLFLNDNSVEVEA